MTNKVLFVFLGTQIGLLFVDKTNKSVIFLCCVMIMVGFLKPVWGGNSTLTNSNAPLYSRVSHQLCFFIFFYAISSNNNCAHPPQRCKRVTQCHQMVWLMHSDEQLKPPVSLWLTRWIFPPLFFSVSTSPNVKKRKIWIKMFGVWARWLQC